jgi:hypothetical protein
MTFDAHFEPARRKFLSTGLGGLGALALGSVLQQEGLVAGAPVGGEGGTGPMIPRPPHFAPKAKRCIYIYLEGGPSQMDLFDPKPKLNELDGEPVPDSLVENVQFAFIQKEGARLMGTPRTFRKHGECGMEFSDLLPHVAGCADDIAMIRSMHTDQFNHVPGQLMMNTGAPIMGRPSLGSWLCYGLGSLSQNLPGFVSLVTVGRGIPGGSASWSSGFLPSSYSGVQLRSDEDPVLNLGNPPGVSRAMQEASIRGLNDLNRLRLEEVRDRELAARISSYELAFRMQSAAPELVDLSGETRQTLEAYGLDRKEPPIRSNLGGVGLFGPFARNCLLARRLVERGVRFIELTPPAIPGANRWDQHDRLKDGHSKNALACDKPIAGLLKDLKSRGLLDQTLVVWAGEFGRTPVAQGNSGGRDHSPYAFSIWLAGGGVKGAVVYAATDE